MKILHITGDVTRYNGAARQALSLAEALQERGCECFFLAHTDNNNLLEADKKQIFVTKYDKLSSFISTFARIIQTQPDVVHCHGFFIGAIIASILLRRPLFLKTTLAGEDDFEAICNKGRFQSWIARRIAINNALSEHIAKINRHFLDSEQVIVIPNGVRVPEIVPIVKVRPPLMLVVGAVNKRKRIDLAIDFFCYISQCNEQAILEIIGPIEDSVYQQYCISRISKDLYNRIRFVGELPFEDSTQRMAAASALIFASEREGMPNVIIEAMAHNCVPIIIGNDPVARDVILKTKGGGIILDDWARFKWVDIKKIIDKKSAFIVANTSYNIKIIAEKHIAVYKKIAQEVEFL